MKKQEFTLSHTTTATNDTCNVVVRSVVPSGGLYGAYKLRIMLGLAEIMRLVCSDVPQVARLALHGSCTGVRKPERQS